VVEAICLNNLGAHATLGILPSGTGNVLARNLKIDLNDLVGAVNRGLHGNRHPIDLGLVRLILEDGRRAERVFSVMAGMGLDAKIFQKTDPKLKKAIGWVAYIEGGIKSLPTLFERMDVSVDSREPRNLKVVSLIIGNVGWLPGKITLMPDASLTDGILDVAAVGPRRFWNWIDFWGRVTWLESLRENRQLRHLIDASADVRTLENLSGKRIRVTPENPVYIQLDGDPIGSVVEAEFEVQPGAVTVRL
jgi:diacylglycerol kinase (ATP)